MQTEAASPENRKTWEAATMWWQIWMQLSGHTGTFGSHVRLGEGAGWVTLILSLGAAIHGMGAILGSLTPDQINPWLILIGSLVTGAVAVGTLAYSRIVRARLDGETLEAIFQANNEAIRLGKPVPWPAFLPRGAVTVTTTTVVDVSAKGTTAPLPESKPPPEAHP